MRRGICAILTLATVLTAGASATAAADEILLIDGRLVVGEVVEERPDSIVVRVPYGTFSLPRGRIVSITRQDKYAYHLAQGDHFAARDQIDVAVGEYRKAAGLRPDDAAAREKYHAAIGRLGLRHLKFKRHAEARATFERLLELDGNNLDAKAGLRQLEERLGALRRAIAAADVAAASGRPDEAIAALEKVLEEAPDMLAELAGKLAVAYRLDAEQYYGARRFEEAAVRFRRALELKPDLAAEIEGRYISSLLPGVVAAVEAGNAALAESRLKQLLEFAPLDPRALLLAGTISANRGDLDAAAQYFSRALGRRWSGRADQEQVAALHGELRKTLGGEGLKLDRPFQERYVESAPGDWKKIESERFTVYHHNDELARVVAQSAEQYLDRVMAGLGLSGTRPWAGRCPIYIHRDQQSYREASGQPDWSSGVSNVKSQGGRLVEQRILTFQTAPKLLNSVLPHELGHLVFMGSVRYSPKVPLAIHEGVAVFGELAFRRSFYQGVLTGALRTESTIPVGELLEMKEYPQKPDLFYAQSASLVQYLIEAKGSETFHRFAASLDTLGLRGALEKHYGFKDFEETDGYWKAYAAGKRG
jgi:tetratricopeptide (TPR) repeat protein